MGNRYVVRGGEQVFAPPFMQKDTRIQAFALRGDTGALQATCDRYLNAPSGGETSYRVLSHYVLLAYAPIGSTQSTEPPDKNYGWTPETDVAFWMLVGAGHQKGDDWILDRLAWFLPYVWVNNPTTMATGRETYGYPKELGWLSQPDDDTVFAMETLVLPTHEPTTELTRKPILSVTKTSSAPESPPLWKDAKHALRDLERLLDPRSSSIVPGLDFWLHLVEYVVRREVPMVFLKQFRDIADPQNACYQAIIESPAKIAGLPWGGLVGGTHEATIHNYASHPIAADLGLGTPDPNGTLHVTPALAFHVQFDFLVELGTIIWGTGSPS